MSFYDSRAILKFGVRKGVAKIEIVNPTINYKGNAFSGTQVFAVSYCAPFTQPQVEQINVILHPIMLKMEKCMAVGEY